MGEYILHRQAESDLMTIARWIQRDNQDAARRFLDGAFAEFDFIADWPEASRFAGLKPKRLQRIRVRPLGPPFNAYLVFYGQTGGELHIYRVLHGTQNWRLAAGLFD